MPDDNFGNWCRSNKISSIAVFGDSITVGLGASEPSLAWPALIAGSVGAQVINRGISGTVLQKSPDASGRPRADNGFSRYEQDLLAEPIGALCILYGYNDARYIAAPESFNAAAFTADYRAMIAHLLEGGYTSDSMVLGSPPYPCDAGFQIGAEGFTGQTRDGFEGYVAAVGAIASEFDLAYAPVYEGMKARPDGALASSDVTHPNNDGHRVIADAFLHAKKVG